MSFGQALPHRDMFCKRLEDGHLLWAQVTLACNFSSPVIKCAAGAMCMAVNLQQTIQEQMRVLSEEEMREVLNFVTALRKRKKEAPLKPLSAVFEELSNELPLEQWRALPADGAENHDHYLYGAPKKAK
jgi:hypothetical protein